MYVHIQYPCIPLYGHCPYNGRGAQVPGAMSSWGLQFVRWHEISVGPQYGTCCMSSFWRLTFCGGSQVPLPRQWRHLGVQLEHNFLLTSELNVDKCSSSGSGSFTAKKEARYPMNSTLDGTHSRSGRFRGGKKTLYPVGI